MNKILYTAFNGKNNSSKILLDSINTEIDNKLYLKNSFKTSVVQLEKKIIKNEYDLIISFGQCPLDLNVIKLEINGKSDKENLSTGYDLTSIKNNLQNNNYKVILSNDAGNYLCNNIYYHGLKIIENNNLKCNMIFIHIPMLENIDNIKKLASIVNDLGMRNI